MESKMGVYIFIALLVSTFTGMVLGERTKDKMYEAIDGTAACFRRLNGTHQFGCTSGRQGNVGVIQLVTSSTDLDWLLKRAKAGPYMVVLLPHMFNSEVMLSLKESGIVSGVLLSMNTTSDIPDSFSPDDTCPNRYSGSGGCDDNTSPWNPPGNSLMLVDWGFPVFYLEDAETLEKIVQCYLKFNENDREEQESRSLCALEMNAFMFAAVDTETCIRRNTIATNNLNPIRYCDPLGDRSIWSTLHPRSKQHNNATSVIVVATRLDSTSMFDNVVPGAVTPTTGIVLLLATAHLLKQMLPTPHPDTNVMFTLLHGESYDYIGSSRLLYDLQRDHFPSAYDTDLRDQPALLRLQDIQLFVELNQMNVDKAMYVHRTSSADDKVLDFLRLLQEEGRQLGWNITDVNNNRIPPASLQTFLKEEPGFPGLVLADHQAAYTNKYYHSIYDDSSHLGYKYSNGSGILPSSLPARITTAVLVLARSIYRTITDRDYTGTANANITLVDELLHCYLDTNNCSVFNSATTHQQLLADSPSVHYVGVSVSSNVLTTLTGYALAMLTGDDTNLTETECHNNATNTVFQYLWMSGHSTGVGNDTGVCVKTTMNTSPAVSPAFIIDDYDWTSGKYSTWSESIWREFTVRMFLKPSRSQETITFCVGAIVLVLSFVLVYLANSKAEILFGGNTLGAAC